jgi:H+/Cl- antiporter ClcA
MISGHNPRGVIRISLLAAVLGLLMAGVAQFLLWLIEFITAAAFFGEIGKTAASPMGNQLGWMVIFVPVIGGLLVGVMARFGSPAIRGHGIPEAMEQVLENASRIPARLTWLKPLSAAISIGTGGPFGAEGPIIATGGASGSLLGQILPGSAADRKTLLAAGAAAGMAATFGSPLSAILLAVELLLFEFKPRSLIPVTIAVSVALVVRVAWLGSAPVFPMPTVVAPSISAFASLLFLSIFLGVAAFGISRAVYWIEDRFDKLPIHWMWWPPIGALAVGTIGYVEPRTLGVGYYNITDNLAGTAPLTAVLLLCGLNFLSWSISLGSGTSGGTLAPLMTIGSALGWILGVGLHGVIPDLDPHLAALIGMAAVFGGASQAMLAAAVFAYETTGQSSALFPLLACTAVAVMVVRLLGKTSIMTEKIERRGVSVPSQFSADIFEHTRISSVMEKTVVTVPSGMPLPELAHKMATQNPELGGHHAYPVIAKDGQLAGIITRGDVIRAAETAGPNAVVLDYATTKLVVARPEETLHEAITRLLQNDVGRLPVVACENPKNLVGYLSRSAILSARWKVINEETSGPAWTPWKRAPEDRSG